MFENKLTHNGIFYSRYIASWKRMGGKIYRGGLFEQWLREKEELTDSEISEILQMAENGKIELESSAKEFMEQNEKEYLFEKEMADKGRMFEECHGTHMHQLKKWYAMRKNT